MKRLLEKIRRPTPIFFLGIGAQKSGSSWLHWQLYNHPEIWVPPLKEIRYFDNIDNENNAKQWLRERYKRNAKKLQRAIKEKDSRAPYLEELTDWLKYAITQAEKYEGREFYDKVITPVDSKLYRAKGEVTPSYSAMSVEKVEKLYNYYPDAKLIFIMRDPVQRAWSMARHIAIRNRQDYSLLKSEDFLRKFIRDKHYYNCGRYDRTIENYEKFFPNNQINYSFFEEIFQGDNCWDYLEEICEFLNISYNSSYFPEAHNPVLATEKVNMPKEAELVLLEAFQDVYDYIKKRFGRLPEAWMEHSN
ncbi:sulfotransferase [Halomonas sp. LR3S48]|uniref:sulfotransferase n=1 Tax=Halomonas sp. LR3S48 TaxID=2982694 RepID=UPI0021E35C65|nr:sulfotransferase [Halomonas sp. LR3S48]UYG01954.1 sulfotransferase [Halomonas sp. LR3S48]